MTQTCDSSSKAARPATLIPVCSALPVGHRPQNHGPLAHKLLITRETSCIVPRSRVRTPTGTPLRCDASKAPAVRLASTAQTKSKDKRPTAAPPSPLPRRAAPPRTTRPCPDVAPRAARSCRRGTAPETRSGGATRTTNCAGVGYRPGRFVFRSRSSCVPASSRAREEESAAFGQTASRRAEGLGNHR